MEELLNKLIEKGWYPRWESVYKTRKKNFRYIKYIKNWDYKIVYYTLYTDTPLQRTYKLRELVSKESGLRQFVCENWMIIKHIEQININPFNNDGKLKHQEYHSEDYEYRLIESALCDEDKLEDFILNKIKM